ncbi:hypothetical protein FGG08_007566, partial [Glutinoglossum americanum]
IHRVLVAPEATRVAVDIAFDHGERVGCRVEISVCVAADGGFGIVRDIIEVDREHVKNGFGRTRRNGVVLDGAPGQRRGGGDEREEESGRAKNLGRTELHFGWEAEIRV